MAEKHVLSTLPDKMKSRPPVVLSCEQKSAFSAQMAKIRILTHFWKNNENNENSADL